jgi:hypothetical protein
MPGLSDACLVGKVLSDVDADNMKRYFEVECVPTFDENNVKVSDLIAFRDVTVLQTLLDISDLTVSTSSPGEPLDKAITSGGTVPALTSPVLFTPAHNNPVSSFFLAHASFGLCNSACGAGRFRLVARSHKTIF